MTLTVLFALLAAAHFSLMLATSRALNNAETWIVRALLLGLCFDNTVLALGVSSNNETWYYGASEIRYAMHVFVLPPLVLAALRLAGRAGIAGLESRYALLTGLTFAVAAIAFGFVTELANLELIRESLGDHVRLVSADAMLPLATIVTNLVLLVLTAYLWRRSGWPWLFAATLSIFLINGGLAGSEWGIVAGNLAEVVFALAWVAALLHFNSRGQIDNSHMRND